MKTVLMILMSLTAITAVQAETVCKDYQVRGNLTITKLCAESEVSRVYQNLRFETNQGVWPIAPGVVPANRAMRLCKILEGKMSPATFELKMGASGQSTLNLWGNFAFRGSFHDYEQIFQVTCQ